MQELVSAFNPATVPGLMCRNTIPVSWDGYLYDCNFNQMLDLKVEPAPIPGTSIPSTSTPSTAAPFSSTSIVTAVPPARDRAAAAP